MAAGQEVPLWLPEFYLSLTLRSSPLTNSLLYCLSTGNLAVYFALFPRWFLMAVSCYREKASSELGMFPVQQVTALTRNLYCNLLILREDSLVLASIYGSLLVLLRWMTHFWKNQVGKKKKMQAHIGKEKSFCHWHSYPVWFPINMYGNRSNMISEVS